MTESLSNNRMYNERKGGDLTKAIKNQLKDYNLAEIKESKINTYTDPNYASHRGSLVDINKKGQNIVGFYYK